MNNKDPPKDGSVLAVAVQCRLILIFPEMTSKKFLKFLDWAYRVLVKLYRIARIVYAIYQTFAHR